jgi:multiple sugar transport system ATP-binding protein
VASIRLEGLHKTYPNGHVAVSGIDIEVADGEFLVLVGPSGCGKSTVLRLVAGLESPTGGRVLIAGTDVTERTPRERDVAMVFQSYALYPHMRVRENLAFGLRMRSVAGDEIRRRVEETAARLGLEDVLERRPAELSGGQRQRVALGRALVRQPRAFLLDEPLSNLDAKLRVETRAELARLHRHLGATILYVTHDQEEAMTLGDRIAVMRAGRLEQIGAPLDVYRRPATVFVADFIGSPAMNWFEGRIRREAGRTWVRCERFAVECPEDVEVGEGALLRLGVRPHDLEIDEPGPAALRAAVEVVQTLGSARIVHAAVGAGEAAPRVTALDTSERPLGVGQEIGLRIRPECIHLFDPDTERRLERSASA